MEASTLNKEQVYDQQISPLVRQILDICKNHGIAMIASFAIPTPENDALRCTSILPDESGNNPDDHVAALRALQGSGFAVAMTITRSAQ